MPRPDPLQADLIAILGPDGLVTRAEELLTYDCDAFTTVRQAPRLVALPRDTAQVAAVVRACHQAGVPFVPRGAGTGLSGGALAAPGGVMIALTRMTRVHELDVANRRALVDAGVVNLALTRQAQGHGLAFAPDPSSQMTCTLGGNVAENAGGPHTLKYGVTSNHVLGLELVQADGRITWLGTGLDDVPGYDLRGLITGSEGTTGIVTRAWVRLVPVAPAVRTMLAVFETVDAASEAVSGLITGGLLPAALEMMDRLILRAVEESFHYGFPLDAEAVLIVELDGLEAGLDAEAARARTILEAHGAREVRLARDEDDRARLWNARKKAVGCVGRLAPSKVTQDGVIPRTRLPEVLRAIYAIGDAHGLRIANVFHAGDGNLHPVVLFDERDPEQVRRMQQAGTAILEACLAAGGSITGEHGVGVEKLSMMERQFGAAELAAMHRLRAVFDPAGRCNPGKLLPTSRHCVETGGATCPS